MAVIRVQGVSKAFKRYPSQWARAREWFLGIQSHEIQWVLQDISFVVEAGSAMGILGANGAGKSTLLKIISGATTPTAGDVQIDGRVAALLELGMGFHPEFSGRQNAMMAGQLLGLDVSEVETSMHAIESFAGIGDFIDQPLRTYSSGMQMRLAFSVATAIRPEVLIIDEALSVGDAAFQRKCFQRIEDFRSQGTTLLFVSHDIEAVKRLCDKAVFLFEGRAENQGSVRPVCDAYERILFSGERDRVLEQQKGFPGIGASIQPNYFDVSLSPDCEQAYGSGEAEIETCWLESMQEERINVVAAGELVRWCFDARFDAAVDGVVFSMMLKTLEGEAVFGTDSTCIGQAPHSMAAGQRCKVVFSIETWLAPGHYYLNCGIRQDTEEGSVFLSRRVDAAILRISSSKDTSVLVGAADLRGRLVVTNLETNDCE